MRAAEVEQRIRGVTPQVAGRAVVPVALLAKRLGHKTLHVLQLLWAKRNREGVTHITNLGLSRPSGYVPTSLNTVKAAVALLVEAKLVEPVGYQFLAVPDRASGKTVIRKVYLRRVRGAELHIADPAWNARTAAVPSATLKWLQTPTRRGGKRAGAGRPITNPNTRLKAMLIAHFGLEEANRRGCPVITHETAEKHAVIEDNQTVPQDSENNQPVPRVVEINQYPSTLSLSKRENSQCVHAHGSSFVNERKTAPPQAADAPLVFLSGREGAPGLPTAPGGLTEQVTANGLTFGGTTRAPPAPLPGAPLAGVPPFPGNAVVAPAVVPEPPALRANMGPLDLAAACAAAYRGAVTAEYGARCHTLARGLEKSRYAPLLAASGAALRDLNVTPQAWCAFAVRRWRRARMHTAGWKAGDPVPLPPLSVIFRPATIAEQCETGERADTVRECVRGGRVVFGATHRALLTRHAALYDDLHRGTPRAAAVQKHFPDGLYDQMVEDARSEAVDIRYRFERDIRAGRWVW